MNKILLYGNGGHSSVIQSMIEKRKDYELYGIADDSQKIEKKNRNGIILIPGKQMINHESKFDNICLAIGSNEVRKKLAKRFDGSLFATLTSIESIIATDVSIGEGTVVMPGAIINPGAKIGKHCIINSGAIIEHDCVVSDFCHVSPGAVLTGAVVLGESVHVGANATVLPNLLIADEVTIGAGSVVTKSINETKVTVKGNPAKKGAGSYE